MEQIRFTISKNLIEQLTWEEYEAFEDAQEGKVRLKTLRPLVARFMVDEQEQSIPHEAAMKQLGKVPVAQLKNVMVDFANAMRGAAVPLAKGNPSPSPSEAGQATDSPAG